MGDDDAGRRDCAEQGDLYGRDEERSTLERVLAETRQGASGVLVLRGEAGIGKTALLAWAGDVARGQGMEVLSARGIESEAEVSFGGLLELLKPVCGELERIPSGQAEALRAALGLGPAVEGGRFMVGAATLSLLSVRSEHAPLLAIVDDAHWFDESSMEALVFAARRLIVDPVAILFAVRGKEAPAIDAARLPELPLAGVDADAAARIVRANATGPVPPGVGERLQATTGGNPLALVELARRPDLSDLSPEAPFPTGTTFEGAYARRIRELPAPTRTLLALSAAERSGQMAWIAAAAEQLGLDLSSLEAAESLGLVSISFGTLRWRHPLISAAAFGAVSAQEQRAFHAALADAISSSDPDRWAWHRASAAVGPDELVATALEEAGLRARSRGAYPEAATALQRAAQLTPAGKPRAGRLFAAAEAAWLAGNHRRALSLLADSEREPLDSDLRAEIGRLRGQALMRIGDVMGSHEVLVEAAEAIESVDPKKAVAILAEATDACVYAGRPAAMLPVAARAAELLPPDASPRERFLAGFALGTALIWNGEGRRGSREIREALPTLTAPEGLSDDPRLLCFAGLAWLWLREREGGSSSIDRAVEIVRARGAFGALPFVLSLAARDAATTDRWEIGRALYEEAIGLARETDQAMPLCGALAGLAVILARQGEGDACEAAAREALTLAERHGLFLFRLWATDALADLELGAGRLEPARNILEEKQALLGELGLTDPDSSSVPELVEALARLDRAEVPAGLLEAFSEGAKSKGQPWALARLERTHGLLAEPGEMEDHLSAAFRWHEATADGFEQARTHLCYGEALRRGGKRVRAREQLRAALEAFEGLGAAPWIERTQQELLASGERARKRDPSTVDDLTPRELQIALTLTSGDTTREAAAKFFLSPKTIEYHLRNVYRKLQVNSRSELSRELARRGFVPSPQESSL